MLTELRLVGFRTCNVGLVGTKLVVDHLPYHLIILHSTLFDDQQVGYYLKKTICFSQFWCTLLGWMDETALSNTWTLNLGLLYSSFSIETLAMDEIVLFLCLLYTFNVGKFRANGHDSFAFSWQPEWEKAALLLVEERWSMRNLTIEFQDSVFSHGLNPHAEEARRRQEAGWQAKKAAKAILR